MRSSVRFKHRHPVMIEREESLIPADLLAQQQFKTRLGGLELIPGVFQVLHLLQHLAQRGLVRFDIEFLARLGGDVAVRRTVR